MCYNINTYRKTPRVFVHHAQHAGRISVSYARRKENRMAEIKNPSPSPAGSAKAKPSTGTAAKVVFIITVVVCAVLIPILILNTVMIVQFIAEPEKAPSVFGYVPRMVTEDDFEPDIMEGDIIFAKVVDPSEVKEGDVILFFGTSSKDKDKIFIQKVTKPVENDDGSLKGWNAVELGKEYKGEENASTTYTIPTKNLVGVYEGDSIPKLASVMMFMQSIPGMIICVAVPMLLIIGYELIREQKEKKKNKEDTAALMAELETLRALQSQLQNPNSDQVPPTEQTPDGEDVPPETDDT